MGSTESDSMMTTWPNETLNRIRYSPRVSVDVRREGKT